MTIKRLTEPNPVSDGSIRLVTADGHSVCTVLSLPVAAMVANSKPPEMVVWGQRMFVRSTGIHDPHPVYVEGLAYYVCPSDTVTLGR